MLMLIEPTMSSVLSFLENYRKGKNVEEPLCRENIPIPNLPTKFIWMRVNGGSKIRHLLDAALKGYDEQGAVVWSGAGPAIGKTISCAEILKRKHKSHQITKICYRKVEEFWEPLLPELDQLVVVREEPAIHILLSSQSLDKEEPGYQAPGCTDISFRMGQRSDNQRKSGRNNHKGKPRVSQTQINALGLRTGPKRQKNNSQEYDRSNRQSSSASKPPTPPA